MKDFLAEIDLKKSLILGISFIGIIVLLSSVILYYFNSNEDNTDDSNIVETAYFPQEDTYQVERTVKSFINTAGNFGFDYKKAYEMNSRVESLKIALMDAHADNPAFISRHVAYTRSRDYIVDNSPLYYPISQTLSWDNNIEVGGDFERMFSVEDITISIPETMGATDFSGTSHSFIDVNVKMDSRVSYAQQSSNDATWNGEIAIFAKDFEDEEFTIRMMLIEDKWQVYNIIDLNNEFLLATWSLPEFNYIQSEISNGFELVDSFFIELPYPPEQVSDTTEELPEEQLNSDPNNN